MLLSFAADEHFVFIHGRDRFARRKIYLFFFTIIIRKFQRRNSYGSPFFLKYYVASPKSNSTSFLLTDKFVSSEKQHGR